jgi:hypothetical protein
MDATLQELVEEVFADPTLDGLDEMLAQLRERRHEPSVAELIDDLLDHRIALAGGATAA